MGKKWVKVDPADIKAGDRVKLVDEYTDRGVKHRDACRFEVTDVVIGGVNNYAALSSGRTWYIRQPKPAKYRPLVRPDEPPVGAFFRISDGHTAWLHTGEVVNPYVSVGDEPFWADWNFLTKPGDTITRLWLTEEPTE